MSANLALLGGDARQRYLAQRLRESGFCVHTFAVPGLSDTHGTPQQAVRDVRAVILPMPALENSENVRCAVGSVALPPVLSAMPPGAVLMGGKLSQAACHFERFSVRWIDYADDPALPALNALPTAEGALAIAMDALPITLSGSRVLVIGFGRIGAVLSEKLRALGAEVTVSSSGAEKQALCRSLGFRSDYTGHYQHDLSRCDCIFNTVPAPVLSAAHIRRIRPDCPIIDLASAPGGLFPDAPVPELYRPAPALPGKAAPKTAADAIWAAIAPHLSSLL